MAQHQCGDSVKKGQEPFQRKGSSRGICVGRQPQNHHCGELPAQFGALQAFHVCGSHGHFTPHPGSPVTPCCCPVSSRWCRVCCHCVSFAVWIADWGNVLRYLRGGVSTWKLEICSEATFLHEHTHRQTDAHTYTCLLCLSPPLFALSFACTTT